MGGNGGTQPSGQGEDGDGNEIGEDRLNGGFGRNRGCGKAEKEENQDGNMGSSETGDDEQGDEPSGGTGTRQIEVKEVVD